VSVEEDEEFNFRAVNANFCQSNNAGLLQWVFSDGVDVQAADDGIVREHLLGLELCHLGSVDGWRSVRY